MPMNDDQRRAYLQRAGVSRQQIDETVGELPVHAGSARAAGLSDGDAERARSAIRQVLADSAIIAAKYSIAAQGSGPAAAEVGPDEFEADRGYLDELFADEYALMNPFGEEQDKTHVVDAMLKGMIAYDGMGRAGFEALGQSLQVHGNTAVGIGDYRMQASSRAKDTGTGEVIQHGVSGTYRITNTYVHRDNRWQATITQMTQIPPDPKFTLTPDA
jgi:hypothetical protein